MILSDRSLREEIAAGRIIIDPFDDSCVQPSSVDLHLDHRFLVFRNHTMGHIDVRTDLSALTEQVEVAGDDPFILHPGEFVLGSTSERVGVPDDLVARLEGKSSLGRLGLLIHSTAGYVDAGWDGQLTLACSRRSTARPFNFGPAAVFEFRRYSGHQQYTGYPGLFAGAAPTA